MKQRVFLAIGTIVLCAGLLAGCGKITKSVEINYGETYKIEDEKLEGKENLTCTGFCRIALSGSMAFPRAYSVSVEKCLLQKAQNLRPAFPPLAARTAETVLR